MTNAVHLTKDKMAAANGQATAVQPIPDGRMQLFSQLKPYTSQLLRARDSPARLQGLLRSLQNVIRNADVDALNSRGIFDYILFPLMPGVDSIVLLRRPGIRSMYAAPVRHAVCHIHLVQPVYIACVQHMQCSQNLQTQPAYSSLLCPDILA